MKNNKKHRQKLVFSSSLAGIIIATWCCQLVGKQIFSVVPKVSASMTPIVEIYKPDHEPVLSFIYDKNLNPKVLNLALKAYYNAKKAGLGTKDILTIVDYSMPSTTSRMWVIDMSNNKIIYNTYVAHGKGSGDNYANKFSNQHGSLMSSLGLFLTGSIYSGHYGESLTLHGLEEKFNDNALSRHIVMHKASYVDEWVIKKIGRLGRSFGCLALNQKVADKIMNTIKNGSLVFCYYPDKTWLSESKMLAT